MAKPKAGKEKEEGNWPARSTVALPYSLALVFLGRTLLCGYRVFESLFTFRKTGTVEDTEVEIWTPLLLGISYFVMAAATAVIGTRLSEGLLRVRTAPRLVGLALASALLVGLTTLWLAAALLGKWLSWGSDAALAAGSALFEFLIALSAGWPSLRARRPFP